MKIAFVFPGDLDTPTGGYRYDRAIISQLRTIGHEIILVSLPGEYPFPSLVDKKTGLEIINSLEAVDIAIVDGLAGGAHPKLLELLSRQLSVVSLLHHPLCLETGLTDKQSKKLKESEANGLRFIARVITTSPTTSNTIENLFKYNAERIRCVLPGVERGTTAKEWKEGPISLLCVGSVIPRKGHQDLIEALVQLSHHDWKLTCVGNTDFDPQLFQKIRQSVAEKELQDRVIFTGPLEPSALEQAYTQAHLFVLPSHYEGYGMAYAEAIVRGIPVIATTAGAIPQTVPKDCGILVKPGIVETLSEAIETMITDHTFREVCRAACLAAEPNFPTWKSAGSQFSDILRGLL